MSEINNITFKEEAMISVIIPSYNAGSFIKDTLQSVQSQTYTNWEIIIVDDVSTDNTCELIKAEIKKDDRIRLIELQENGGAAIARNTGINNAKGRYIAFLDSDDLWLPEKLEKQLAFMQNNDVAFSFTSYQIMNQDGILTDKVVHVPEKINYNGLLKNTIIGCLTVMLDIEKLGKVQMPNIRTRQDTATWLKILKQGHCAYGLDEVLSKYRKVENSISSKKFKMAKMNWKLYREIEGLSIPKSAWCFVNYALNGVVKHFIK
ncbi:MULTISPECIES: glycosyltransferase family 2 protein [Bacillus cereus group]|uniref:glycosyltransferase family 2 protein n=1 Tax=Bacillus cereus group TaxID=86661 RepID=UPI0011202E18|nr:MULTISPECIES: glycosyltransferase family 2 protein [Bacillus cereus group]MDW3038834.1 glycosyltransferase family 2 protein [Bacillus pacificus]TNP03318.1 glycosyltransferase family 2 protein [Bacillus pacificus]